MTPLTVFGRRQGLARVVLIEASSLGPAQARKRREVLGRFAALVRRHLDEAIAEDSIPPVDTRVAACAWPGALNEVGLQSLQGELPALAERRALSPRGCSAPPKRRAPAPPRALREPSTELSTYPPSSTDGNPPRLVRTRVVRSARSRDRSVRARPRRPIDR